MPAFFFGERLGMLFPIMGGCLSAMATSLVLLLAVLRWLRRTTSKRKYHPDATDNILFLNLMLADLIQALGELPIIRWMAEAVITEGRLCTAQAVVKQVGGDGVALSSLAIAVHTFCVLVLRWSAPKIISKIVALTIWMFITLVIAIPYLIHRNELYGDVGYWCWVKLTFKTEQLVTEYIWLWVSLFLMIILYAIMFTVMRNYTPNVTTGRPVEETQEEKDSKAMAKLLLLYPAVYLICIIPYSFARWFHFSGFKVPYQITLFTATLFSLSGTFNATLFFFTRPHLVIGSANSPPAASTVDIQTQAYHDRELTSPSSWKFGSPPPAAFDAVSPDLERDYNPEPYNLILLGEGSNSNIRSSPRRVESDSGNNTTYLSGELSNRDFRPKHAPQAAPVEEESYGRLPG